MKSIQRKDAPFEAALQLHRAGKLDAAADAYRKILRTRPTHPQVLENLGIIYRRQGQYALAQTCFEKVLQLNPRSATTWSNLASLFLSQGKREQAVEAARRAIAEAPAMAAAYDNLGYALFWLNQFDEAEQALLQAVKLDPKAANAWNNLGQVFQRQNRLAEAADAYAHAVALQPDFTVAFSNLLFCMHFGVQWTPEAIYSAHLQWAKKYESPWLARAPMHGNRAEERSELPRVAFISPDLFNHPVAVFLRPLIAHWPHDRFELGFYASVAKPDAVTTWFKEQADFWCDVHALTDDAVATQVVQDNVEVLIDLSGHTGSSRLLVLARRPAPVQMSWLGYFDTTGMKSVDYLIADSVCVPTELERLFVEKILRLPDGFVCFEPPPEALPPGPLPAQTQGHITFGSQNQLAKVTDQVIDLWAELLCSLPTSRLLFQAKAFNDRKGIERFALAFAARGVDAGRIDFLPMASRAGILSNYQRIDIALDPFPCAGGTTTCEALWMGVPVVTLLGDRFGGRHSASHLNNVGLPQLITTTPKQYLSVAQRLAADLPALSALRQQLREQMRTSPLCDGARFARNFASVLATVLN